MINGINVQDEPEQDELRNPRIATPSPTRLSPPDRATRTNADPDTPVIPTDLPMFPKRASRAKSNASETDASQRASRPRST